MIEPGTARTAASVTAQFTARDARANGIPDEDIVAGSVRREEMVSDNGDRPFSDTLAQDWSGDTTLSLSSSDGDKAESADTTLLSLDCAAVTPGGADGPRGCFGLLVTWSTYLKTCHTYRGVGDAGWVGSPTKGPSDSACVVETWLEVRDGSDPAVVVPGTRRYLRAGSRQLGGYTSPHSTPFYRLEKAAYITCDGACLLTEERLTAIGVTSVTQVQLHARYVMSDTDYNDLTTAGVATPEAVLTDSTVTIHIVRNAEMT